MDTRKRRKNITSIQVDLSTRDQLDKLANRRREPYNDIIVRLIHNIGKKRHVRQIPVGPPGQNDPRLIS